MDNEKLTIGHFKLKVKELDRSFPNLLDAQFKQKLFEIFQNLSDQDFSWAIDEMIENKFVKSKNGTVEIFPPKLSYCRELALNRKQTKFGRYVDHTYQSLKREMRERDNGEALNNLKKEYGASSVLEIMEKMKLRGVGN